MWVGVAILAAGALIAAALPFSSRASARAQAAAEQAGAARSTASELAGVTA
jgi:hypothetical protein